MKIDFEQIQEQELKEFKGGTGIARGRMYLDELGKIMRAELNKGDSIGMHTHSADSEIVYVIQGSATCVMNEQTEIVHAGECHYCPKGSTHTIANMEDEPLIMFCVIANQ